MWMSVFDMVHIVQENLFIYGRQYGWSPLGANLCLSPLALLPLEEVA